MRYFDSATHDPVTATLTVTTVTPSRESWTMHEYRDVPTRLAVELAAAPHSGEFLRERVAPFHDSRAAARATGSRPPRWTSSGSPPRAPAARARLHRLTAV